MRYLNKVLGKNAPNKKVLLTRLLPVTVLEDEVVARTNKAELKLMVYIDTQKITAMNEANYQSEYKDWEKYKEGEAPNKEKMLADLMKLAQQELKKAEARNILSMPSSGEKFIWKPLTYCSVRLIDERGEQIKEPGSINTWKDSGHEQGQIEDPTYTLGFG